MKQRKWAAEEKVAIVLESLRMQKEGRKYVEAGKANIKIWPSGLKLQEAWKL